jgi:hypothetical protein
MDDEDPKQPDPGFDVVMPHGKTEDGEGARVLRARPGRLEAGEVRPLRDGKPMLGRGEIVSLSRRKDAPALYDVKVEHVVDAPQRAEAETQTQTQKKSTPGPAQVATRAYRESWERIFGRLN